MIKLLAQLYTDLTALSFVETAEIKANPSEMERNGLRPMSIRAVIGPRVLLHDAHESIARVLHRRLPAPWGTSGSEKHDFNGWTYHWDWREEPKP